MHLHVISHFAVGANFSTSLKEPTAKPLMKSLEKVSWKLFEFINVGTFSWICLQNGQNGRSWTPWDQRDPCRTYRVWGRRHLGQWLATNNMKGREGKGGRKEGWMRAWYRNLRRRIIILPGLSQIHGHNRRERERVKILMHTACLNIPNWISQFLS